MPATRYKIWAIGSPVGQGATQSMNVGVAGIAKKALPQLPYTVANELICVKLARAVLLPIPPGFIIEEGGEPYYVSLNFNLAGQDLPPANVSDLVQNHPNLACGIILFDAWVVNGDRHRNNIAYDTSTNKVQIYDHSHAFCYGNSPEQHLETNRENLGIGGHCLASAIQSLDGFAEWAERIKLVPDYYIREVISSTVELGLPEDQVNFCSDYLIERKSKLMGLIRTHDHVFSSVDPGLWSAL